jgi:cyclopropane fatty-acyl-phospholipid synthase-like methyltransferase
MANVDTLCGWGEKDKVDYFVQKSDLIIPKRQEQLNFLVDLFPWQWDEPIRVLDLGAGYGAIADAILHRYYQATIVCVDGSEAMLQHARPRLAKHGAQVQLFLRDLSDPSWRAGLAGPFHATVSAVALHHLTDERKAQLCHEVFDLLLPGGLFVNDDVVEPPAFFQEHFSGLADRAIQEQEKANTGTLRSIEDIRAERAARMRPAGQRSHIAPLSAQLDWWRAAGFTSVDCYWKFLNLAIFGGVKPA